MEMSAVSSAPALSFAQSDLYHLRDLYLLYAWNVVGKDVQVKDLRERYGAVVLAYGASSDNLLGIPGEVSLGETYPKVATWCYMYQI